VSTLSLLPTVGPKQVALAARQAFLQNGTPTISSLLLGGCGDQDALRGLYEELHPSIRAITRTMQLPCGGWEGLHYALSGMTDTLCYYDVSLGKEMDILKRFFGEVTEQRGRYVFGVQATLAALDMGACSEVLIWDEMTLLRVVHGFGTDTEVDYFSQEAFDDPNDAEVLQKLQQRELQDKQYLTEWLAEKYDCYGCQPHFVSNRSPEGHRFVHGFGGFGAILRYRLELEELSVELQHAPFVWPS